MITSSAGTSACMPRRVVLTALAKSPADRYRSAEAFRDALPVVVDDHIGVRLGRQRRCVVEPARPEVVAHPFRNEDRGVCDGIRLREQGIDAMGISNWRGIFGAKGITAAQIAFWEEAIGKTTGTEDWKKQLETNNLASRFLRSREFGKYLDAEYQSTRAVMADLGLAK